MYIYIYIHIGFSRKREYDTPSQSIYHRKATLRTENSDGDEVAKPIVFIHGIGMYIYICICVSLYVW
jgi:hypothetical protein